MSDSHVHVGTRHNDMTAWTGESALRLAQDERAAFGLEVIAHWGGLVIPSISRYGVE